MANGKIRFGKQSGGELALVIPDGVSNTEVIVPESGELANKEYIDNTTVKLIGDQTIEDIKTFISSPIVPTPTTDFQVANKAYVDDANYLQPSMTENATLTAIDNKIVINGIVTSLGLEVGDVIQFTSVANANNQKLRTVESIINNNEIIVNYEHCGSRGNGSLKLTNETLTNATIKRVAKWYNAPIGMGQAWVEMVGFRGIGTNYTNSQGRSISVEMTVNVGLQSGLLIADGMTVSAAVQIGSGSIRSSIMAVVANNSIYSLSSVASLEGWKELR